MSVAEVLEAARSEYRRGNVVAACEMWESLGRKCREACANLSFIHLTHHHSVVTAKEWAERAIATDITWLKGYYRLGCAMVAWARIDNTMRDEASTFLHRTLDMFRDSLFDKQDRAMFRKLTDMAAALMCDGAHRIQCGTQCGTERRMHQRDLWHKIAALAKNTGATSDERMAALRNLRRVAGDATAAELLAENQYDNLFISESPTDIGQNEVVLLSGEETRRFMGINGNKGSSVPIYVVRLMNALCEAYACTWYFEAHIGVAGCAHLMLVAPKNTAVTIHEVLLDLLRTMWDEAEKKYQKKRQQYDYVLGVASSVYNYVTRVCGRQSCAAVAVRSQLKDGVRQWMMQHMHTTAATRHAKHRPTAAYEAGSKRGATMEVGCRKKAKLYN